MSNLCVVARGFLKSFAKCLSLCYNGRAVRSVVYSLFSLLCLLCSCGERNDSSVNAPSAADNNSLVSHWNAEALNISAKCAACHAKEAADWAGSDHAWALRELDVVKDTAPFHGQRLNAHGADFRFYSNRAGQFLMKDNQTGAEHRAEWVLGRTPLVQYLVKGKDNGWQVPSPSWDVNRNEWFDMFEDDARLRAEGGARRQNGDWGHWQGRGMNWNSQCAWCHTSHFSKNYDVKTDSFASTWKEPGVTCIQCHKVSSVAADDGCLVDKKDRTLTPAQMRDNCASCHARREELDEDFAAGEKFDNHFRLELPTQRGIFWANGMQRDEDYCETGLRLSRMGAAGVTCLDCHDAHSAKLKLPQEDNSLCLRCHASGTPVNGTPTPVIDMSTHTPCPQGSKGSRCVECHMPESSYMARDPRRDHSFNAPDPQLTVELGIPNSCTMCHKEMEAARAAEVVRTTYPEQKLEVTRPRTRAVHAAMDGASNAVELLRLCENEPIAAWRATLLELVAQQPLTLDAIDYARKAASDEDALVRAAAARILGRDALPLVSDKVKLVRRAAAWPLIDYLVKTPQYSEVVKEQEQIALYRAEQPNGAMQLAVIAAAKGDKEEAAIQYERAIKLDPAGLVAYMDYAVFLAQDGRLSDALSQMLAAAKVAPDNAEVQYRIGLLLAEMQQYEYALMAFERALKLDAQHENARRNRDVLQQYLPRKNP